MQLNVAKELAGLKRMSTPALRLRYAEVFGEATNANNKVWLLKRILWRLQANAEGDLSERARRRAVELANDADLRLSPPKPKDPPAPEESAEGCTRMAILRVAGEARLPPPGTVLSRVYKGESIRVTVLADGFEFQGERFKSLSAVAKAVTGQHLNGFAFFKLMKEVAS
jgi:hypothetical protein